MYKNTFYVHYKDGDISHHGVKGQRWGYRRYQNEDGSLTPEGEKRYNKLTGKVNKRMDKRNKKLTKLMNKQEKGSLSYNLAKYAISKNNKTKKDAAEYLKTTNVKQQKKDKRYFQFKSLSGVTGMGLSGSKHSRIFSALDFADNLYMDSVDVDTIKRGRQYTNSVLKGNRRLGQELGKMPISKAYEAISDSIVAERRAAAAFGAGYAFGYGSY